MSLAKAMEGGPPSKKASSKRPAFPETIRHLLPAEEYETLLVMLGDRNWQAAAIATALYQHHEILVGITTIRDYRRRAALTKGV